MQDTYSPALNEYSKAFAYADDPFIFYYTFGDNHQINRISLTRGDFLSLSKKAAEVLQANGCRKGDRILHCFGSNDYHDLAFRMAGAMIGTIPVTVNWQADSLERVIHKFENTGGTMVIFNSMFNPELLKGLKTRLPDIPFFNTTELGTQAAIHDDEILADIETDFPKIIIFTSGTTGDPKAVPLSYRNYATNQATFEQMLEIKDIDRFATFIVNPLHHTNSTAITDWALRRPGSHIHLIERYATLYWRILSDVAGESYDRIVAPTVSRHFDFLEELHVSGRLPVALEKLKSAMAKVDFLIGSAPVGPTTIQCIRKYSNRTPFVRFGSTETCLQVIGIPRSLSEEEKNAIFKKGWHHQINGEQLVGYYIGRPHEPYTKVRIVKSIVPGEEGFLQDVEPGFPGYLITCGDNVMTGYVNNPEDTDSVFYDKWYLGLKDICFALENDTDGELDYFWMSRDSSLVIKGGANYSCEQINAELTDFIIQHFNLPRESFKLAVVGLKVTREHEDACCVTIELMDEKAKAMKRELEESFISKARVVVSKGAKPDDLRFGKIPVNFKGAVLVSELKKEWRQLLNF